MSEQLVRARLQGLARAATGQTIGWLDPALALGVSEDETAGFVLADNDPRAVGRARFWAERRSLPVVHVLAVEGAGHLARRAQSINPPADGQPGGPDRPTVTVWQVTDAEAALAPPVPVPAPHPIPTNHIPLASMITDAGAWPVQENGRLIAEVAGLEVGRVIEDPAGGHQPILQIGVGQADRELSQLVHADAQNASGLQRVIAAVARERTAGSHHPLARIARARWLRSVALADPAQVGAVSLEPVAQLRPDDSVSNDDPVAAVGLTQPDPSDSPTPIIAVFAASADLDLAPEAADYRLLHSPTAEIVVVSTTENEMFNRRGVDLLPNARFMTMPAPWAAP